ncbi:MAG: hypothetical protein AB7O96_19320 [Pseudobdellovibrionaceae bacterium]
MSKLFLLLSALWLVGCASAPEAPPDLREEDQTTQSARVVEVSTPMVVETGPIESENMNDPVPVANSQFFKATVVSPHWNSALTEAAKFLPVGYEIEIGEVKQVELDGKYDQLIVALMARRSKPCTPDINPCELKKSFGLLHAALVIAENSPVIVDWVKYVPGAEFNTASEKPADISSSESIPISEKKED